MKAVFLFFGGSLLRLFEGSFQGFYGVCLGVQGVGSGFLRLSGSLGFLSGFV